MATYNVTISDAEEKALTEELGDIGAWIQTVLEAKARRAMKNILLRETTERPDLMDDDAKKAAINLLEVDGEKKLRVVVAK